MNRIAALLGLTVGIGVMSTSALATNPLSLAVLSAQESVLEEDVPEINLPIEDEEIPDIENPRPYNPLRPPMACPTTTAALTELLIRDIPNYTNRVLQRTVAVIPNDEADNIADAGSLLSREPYRPSFVLIAGQPELEPLDLNDYAFTTDPEAGGPLTQLFFTTLSRQYSGLRFNEVQEYHWLFLAQAYDGWRLALMFSAVDDVETVRSPTPPRENSEGSVGQAVQLWLEDCRAGAIYPL